MKTHGDYTSTGEPSGYINFLALTTLWAHTGTHCNLRCPSCFEHAGPGNTRIQQITLNDVKPILDESLDLGVHSFGFTGGEPFLNRDFLPILKYALKYKPCLVLSNGTEPLLSAVKTIESISQNSPNPLSIRISIDYPEKEKHDALRGEGTFELALASLAKLHSIVDLSIARRIEPHEDNDSVTEKYRNILLDYGLSPSIPIVGFPNLLASKPTPEISENCIKTYTTPEHRNGFMCATSRMVIKKNDTVAIYACTLVDDDEFYNFGQNLSEAVKRKTVLKHKRCFVCFSSGVSCTG